MKKENLLFYACILLNALPVLLFHFFPSMDGPAHLYNAHILKQLWLGQSEVLANWYQVNPAPVPNWSSHALLAGMEILLPAFLADKVLLLVYVAGLPLAFRSLVKRLLPGQKPLVYLIFPFVYNYLFCLGFHNLSLSIPLLLVGLALALRQIETPSGRGWAAQALLLLATYFTHPFSFTLLVLGMGAIWLGHFLRFSAATFRQRMQASGLPLLRIMLACALPLGLLLHFYATQHFYNSGVRLSTGELMRYLKDLRPLIAYHYENELRLTEQLFFLFGALTAIACYARVNSVAGPGSGPWEKWSRLWRTNDLWLSLAILMLVLFFVVPNSASAGMMSDRFALFFLLFWVIWLAVQPFPRWLRSFAHTVVLLLNFGLTYRYIRVARDQNKWASECVAASRQIRAGSVVLPLNYTDNWLAPHFSNYLGIDKPMVILENYEADTGWFPLLWRKPRPQADFGTNPAAPCLPFRYDSSGSAVVADYIFILGKIAPNDSCQAAVMHLLKQNYVQCYEAVNHEVSLYQRKD